MPSLQPDRYENYIFDFDGTLLNLDVDWQGLRQEVARGCSAEQSLEQAGLAGLVEMIVRREGARGRATLANIIKKYEQPAGRIRVSRVNQRLVEFVRELPCFYVISNNLSSTVAAGIQLLGLQTHCRQVVGFDDVLWSKPDLEGYRRLCCMQTISGRTVYVGDQDSDRKFAEKAGIEFIATETLSGL